MTLTLQIENYQALDDGGPARIDVPESGLAVGRSNAMGWVLPDASRHISGHHFDIFHDPRGWWLRDVSTNGTFLQGQRYRMDGPHLLQNGDRFQVGQYIILAQMRASDGNALGAPAPVTSQPLPDRSQAPRPDDDPWAVSGRLEPVDPLPARPIRPMDDFADDFISTGAPYRPQTGLQPADGPVLQPVPAQPPVAAHLSQPVAAPASDSPFGAAPDGQHASPAMPHPAVRETTGVKPPAPSAPEVDFVSAFCKGAGLPPDLYADVNGAALATALGQSMQRVSRQIMMALQDRAAAKQFARTGERTMRAAADNNPLKFLPDPEQAIEAMFLKPRAGFQNGPEGLDTALGDLRLHQAALFAALQPALAKLLGDLAPEGIEAEAETKRLGGNRKAKAWEMFVERWDAKTAPHENGILDEFLKHFAASYRDVAEQGGGGAAKGGAAGKGKQG